MTIQMPGARPTVDPEMQEFLDLCRAVEEGASDKIALLEKSLKARQKDLMAAWESFTHGLEAEPEEFVEKRKPLIEVVESQFLACQRALQKVGTYVAGRRRPNTLTEAARVLARAAPGLSVALSNFEASVLVEGPSRFATVNVFDNLARRLVEGRTSIDRWKASCQSHLQFFKEALAEIDRSPMAKEAGVPERRLAFEHIVQTVEILEQMTADTPPSEFEEALQALTQAHLEMEGAVEEYNRKRFDEGPSVSPHANRLIHAARGVLFGKYPPDVLRGMAEKMREHVRRTRHDMQELARLSSPAMGEEIGKMMEAMDSMVLALGRLTLADRGSPHIEPSLAVFEAAMQRFIDSNEVVRKLDESSGKIPCPHCQVLNAPGCRICSGCQRALPHIVGAEHGSGFELLEADMEPSIKVTRNMKELTDACQAFGKGELAREDFLAVLEIHKGHVRRADARISMLELPEIPPEATDEERALCEQALAYGGDALGLLSQGVHECQAGLEKLETYADSRNARGAQDGLRDFLGGCLKLLQVEELTRNFLADILEEDLDVNVATDAGSAPGDTHISLKM